MYAKWAAKLNELRPKMFNCTWIKEGILPYKQSPTPKLVAKRSANFLQIQFGFTSDSIYFKSIQTSLSIYNISFYKVTTSNMNQ
ncbi:hypothetical protein ACN38_g1779 [Penicillium nordicum]|uniref:Uncharacterized protein n=1 Tax=Penicillium nordicum TaxID=229535 RepID=A0A0M9WJJ9_9EURO|nr:hypothetical protein ACN38_g1779 [Penicillium nordicum]